MAQSLAKIILHIVFSTKDRSPFLRDPALRTEMHHYVGAALHRLDCQPLIVGGVEDHVHLLFSHARTASPSDVVKEIKRSSSIWVKTKSPNLAGFAWQSGYGIFSLGHSQIDATREYIVGQEEHHKRVSFQDEFRQFLKRYEIPFDERYVWD